VNVALRNSNGYPGPIPTRYWRGRGYPVGVGFLGDGTCQVPTPGVPMVYPACPASAPISSGTPAASYTSQPAPAVYAAPTLIATPACASGPAASADSAECIAQVLAAQQQDFGLENAANRAVFLADCLATYPQPPDCYSRSYDQTPTGGYTSDSHAQGPQQYINAQGQLVSVTLDPATGEPATTSTPAPLSAPPPAGGGTGTGTGSKTAAGGSAAGGSGSGAASSPADSTVLQWTIGLGVAAIFIGVMAMNK
jgi:hypothetical protein